ncbi:hypothetical protein [Dactylosporangium darangshiense]|uniref:hypothetical protein n=1 Tax=Dactylosporangium darangshiense TaxID=579108 RepID=UPI00363979E1
MGASGSCSRASTRSLPPAGGWKSARLVSIRAAVHGPNPPPEAVMRRFPLATDTALAEEVSTSPVPKFAGPPGYDVPASTCQLPVLRLLPVKSSRKFWVQPAGVGGAAASAWNAVATGTATIAVAIEVAARILILVRCGVSGLAVPESGCAVIASSEGCGCQRGVGSPFPAGQATGEPVSDA